MTQQTMMALRAETAEKAALILNDAPVFKEVDLFTTALIQGACVDSPPVDEPRNPDI